jgi:hypothetical protein
VLEKGEVRNHSTGNHHTYLMVLYLFSLLLISFFLILLLQLRERWTIRRMLDMQEKARAMHIVDGKLYE